MSTAPHPAPKPTSRPPRRPRAVNLPPAQLIATALAAVVATFAASFLGVTGTVIGAALFSVVTAVGKEVFGTSLTRTGERVRDAVPVTRVLPRVGHAQSDEDGTDDATETSDTTDTTETSGAETRDDEPPRHPSPVPIPRRAAAWKRAALVAAGLFVGVLACVTAVEVFAGRPVSDIVRGDAGKGTTFFGNDQVTTRTVPPTAPTVTVTVTPKVVVTTPTQTQTAPTVIKSTTPTQTTSAPTTSSSTTAPRSTPSSSTATTAPRP